MKIKSLLNLMVVLVLAQLMFACNSSKKYYDFGAHQTAYKQIKQNPASEAEVKEAATLSEVALAAANEKAAQAEAEPALEANMSVAPVVTPNKASGTNAVATTAEATAMEETKTISKAAAMAMAKERISSMTKAEKREMKKEMKNAIKQDGMNGVSVIEVILAIFLPPLAVFLHDGIGTSFWINIILTLLGFLPGVIHALLVVTDTI